jgi:hypothetical protein
VWLVGEIKVLHHTEVRFVYRKPQDQCKESVCVSGMTEALLCSAGHVTFEKYVVKSKPMLKDDHKLSFMSGEFGYKD